MNNAEFAINFFLVVPHYANKAKTLFALTLASVSVYSQKMSVIFMFWSINQLNAHKMNSNSLFMKTSRALRVETQTKKHFIEFMLNMFRRMNSQWRACYGYKPFLTSTFAFIYQFMIQKAFKFIVKYIFGWNLSTKVPWWPFNISYHKFFTLSPSIFFSFQKIVAWSISMVGDWN